MPLAVHEELVGSWRVSDGSGGEGPCDVVLHLGDVARLLLRGRAAVSGHCEARGLMSSRQLLGEARLERRARQLVYRLRLTPSERQPGEARSTPDVSGELELRRQLTWHNPLHSFSRVVGVLLGPDATPTAEVELRFDYRRDARRWLRWT